MANTGRAAISGVLLGAVHNSCLCLVNDQKDCIEHNGKRGGNCGTTIISGVLLY